MSATSRHAWWLLWLAGVAFAQNQRPLPRTAPEVLIAPGARVHVVAHDDLEPDRLRDLARPGVTLWLHTSSNTLRASTLEHLARFDSAFVELRAPLRPVDAAALARAPRVGAWVTPSSIDVASRLPGARRVALQLEGPVSEPLWDQLRRRRFDEVRWAPATEVDLLSWGQFRALAGRRVIAPPASALLPVSCGDRTAADPSVEVHVAHLLAVSSEVFPCGRGTRVVVQPTVDPWLVQSIFVRDPSAELVIEVGADAQRVAQARQVLDALQLGPSR